MQNKALMFTLACTAMILTAKPYSAFAIEEPIAGFIHDKVSLSSSDSSDSISSLSEDDIPIPGFHNIAIANVKENLNIRKGPGQNETIIGKLPANGGCEIIEVDNGSGWTKVTSGKITGYVSSEYILTGTEASKKALEIAVRVATADVNGLNVRQSPSVDASVIDSIALGEELIVLDPLVVVYGEEYDKWVKVSIDSDSSADGTVGYVAKKFVTLSYSLPKASSIEQLTYGKDVSSLRIDIVNYAKQFLGNRYVFGGNSLTKGIDCSGFTQQIYKKYGINISRTSVSQGAGGTKISASNLKPGDLVFYGSGSSINHVAIYMGNNKVIHASNRRDGIKISNMNYRTPIRYVRYIKN